MDEFKELIAQAHQRDLKIMVDLAVSHVGSQHPWVNDQAKEEWLTGQRWRMIYDE